MAEFKECHLYMDGGSLAFQLGMPKAKGRAMVGLPTNNEMHVAKGTPDEDKNVDGAKAMAAVFEKKDAKAFLDGMADDSTYDDNVMPKPMSGKKDAKTWFTSFTKAFPDLKDEVKNAWGYDDFVVDEYVMTGTQKGPFMGIPATNKSVQLHGAESFEMKDGKMVKGWDTATGWRWPRSSG